eukprot:2056144-Pyramimonas_sp.AAC.1
MVSSSVDTQAAYLPLSASMCCAPARKARESLATGQVQGAETKPTSERCLSQDEDGMENVGRGSAAASALLTGVAEGSGVSLARSTSFC